MYFDASPVTMREVERQLRLNEHVLRFNTFKPTTLMEKVNSRKFNDNPWAPKQPSKRRLQTDHDYLGFKPPPPNSPMFQDEGRPNFR